MITDRGESGVLSTHDSEQGRQGVRHWRLFIDGASRNNPGLAGVGMYLVADDGSFYKHGFFVGIKTNNQAEYLALLIGIIMVKHHISGDDVVLINSDSELLVKQIRGEYRVKDPELQKLHKVALAFLQSISYDIGHVLREKNTVADAMANAGIDKKLRLPETFLTILNEYAISL